MMKLQNVWIRGGKAFKGMITAESKAEILYHRHRKKKSCEECSQRGQGTVRLKKGEKMNSYDGNK